MTELVSENSPCELPKSYQLNGAEIEDHERKIDEEVVDVAVDKVNIIKLSKLPLSRVKHIMKFDPDVQIASQESIILVAKATEMFITAFAKDVGKHMQKTKRKTVLKKDIDAAVGSVSQLCFLEGTLD